MCIGSAAVLTDAREVAGSRVGRLDDGRVVSLAFLPEAVAGDTVLLHLGVPVEVLVPDQTEEEGVSS